jgi:alkane 1-monooxygenase
MVSGEQMSNPNPEEERRFLQSSGFDAMIYLAVAVHFFTLAAFFFYIEPSNEPWSDTLGKTLAMGMMCGVFGINIGHELGHRVNKIEQFIAQLMLLTSQYTHFFIEHNEGHHRNVGTPGDPASAVKNEVLYVFVLRGMPRTYLAAWQIEKKRLERKKMPFISLKNRMIRFSLMQLALMFGIFIAFDTVYLLYYLLAAFTGAFLLESINYIEHYGLRRQKINEYRYEDPKPIHSWNSDFVIGRLVLFELTRHSDHHYDPSRKYQVLRSHEEAPQLPGGYPSMVVLALFPPLWFKIMNPRVDKYMGAKSKV